VIQGIIGPYDSYVIIGGVSESTAPSAGVTPPGERATPAGPQPQPIRFFGTTWVEHDAGYRGRRVAVAAGSLTAAVAGAFVLRFGFQGLAEARINAVLMVLAVGGFAVCSALAFQRTWRSFAVPRQGAGADSGAGRDEGREDGSRGLYAVGFVGALLAYFLRSLREAPGEAVARAAYEAARSPH
jgi:hypothetical protein